MSTPVARILVADDAEAIEVFRRMLTGTLPVAAATTVREARQALQLPTALVVCGCHFDEGRMYDLLRHMKATPPLAHIPFMAIRCLPGELDDALYESVKIAVRALGGNAFVDVLRWQRKYGPAEAAHRLTALVHSLAQTPADTG
jgi:CheY-like chemotaxis protein